MVLKLLMKNILKYEHKETSLLGILYWFVCTGRDKNVILIHNNGNNDNNHILVFLTVYYEIYYVFYNIFMCMPSLRVTS